MGRTVPLAGPGGHPFEGHVELEGIAGKRPGAESAPARSRRRAAASRRSADRGAPRRRRAGPTPRSSAHRAGWAVRESARRRRARSPSAARSPGPSGPARPRVTDVRKRNGGRCGRTSIGSGIPMALRLSTVALNARPWPPFWSSRAVSCAGAGNDNSATRRGGSKLDRTNGRTSPLANTWRAFVGGGSPMADNGM